MNNLKKYGQLPLLVMVSLSTTWGVKAKQPGYEYVSAGFSEVEIDDQDFSTLDVSGAWLVSSRFFLEAQVADGDDEVLLQGLSGQLDANSFNIQATLLLNQNWFLTMQYARDKVEAFDLETESEALSLGIGYSVAGQNSYFDINAGYLDGEEQTLEIDSQTFSETGFYVNAFYRLYISDNWEMELDATHHDLDQDNTRGSVTFHMKSVLPVDLYFGASVGYVEGFFGGLRLRFD